MKKKRSSLGDVAKAAGISKSAAGYALRNYPSVSKETRERVQQIAKKLDYAPDARAGMRMAKVRRAKSKELLPIAWINSKLEKDAWDRLEFLKPYLEGARERAHDLGYRIEEIWTKEPGMTMRRLSQILYQRGIEGVVVSNPARHLRLKWDHLSVVSIDGSLLAPGLHRVMADTTYNLLLALKMLKRQGFTRVGVCLSELFDSYSLHVCSAVATRQFHNIPTVSERVPALFYKENVQDLELPAKQIAAWLGRYRPNVIVGHNRRLVRWVEEAGYRVPLDVGVVHLAIDDDVLDWAGIYSNKREIGATAAESVISFLNHHRLGLPKTPLCTLVRGKWRSGKTLLKK